MPATTAASRKRKQTDDMEDSPPKRVTRARAAAKATNTRDAAAAKDLMIKSTSKSTKTSTLLAKGTALANARSSNKPTKTAAATKSLTKGKQAPASREIEEMDGTSDGGDEGDSNVDPTPPPAKTRGRPKKVVQESKSTMKTSGAPRPRGRPPKAGTAGKPATVTRPATSQQARLKAHDAAASRQEDQASESEDDELAALDTASTAERSKEAVKKAASAGSKAATKKRSTTSIKVTAPSTRAAAAPRAAAASRATSATASTAARASVTTGRRRVAFSDEAQDKENRPMSRGSEMRETKGIIVTTGVRGKPARKAAADAAKTENTTAMASQEKQENCPRTNSSAKPTSDEDRPKTPLSPKKIDQVAKGNWSGASPAVDHDLSSEDELSGVAAASRNPAIGLLQQSPVKPPASARREVPFSGISAATPEASRQKSGSARPNSQDGLSLAQSTASLLGRTPVRPPASPLKMAQPVRPGSSSGSTRPKSQEGEQNVAAPTSLLVSTAKRPPASPRKEDGVNVVPGLSSSPAKRIHLNAPRLEQNRETEKMVKKNLLQSPARRPKVAGAMTAIPAEKKVNFAFGDERAQTHQLRAFKFAAATPRRIRALKPSQRLLDDITESGESYLRSKESSPAAPSPADTDGDVSMLDVQDDKIIYTPSKKRTTLFDTPLVNRSRPNSPQKSVVPTPMSITSSIASPTAVAVGPPTDRTSRTLFRDTDADGDSDDDTTQMNSRLGASVSSITPNGSPQLRSKSARQSMVQRRASRMQARDSLRMTPLAHQFSAWLAASPEKSGSEDSEANSTPSTTPKQSPAKKIVQPQEQQSFRAASISTSGGAIDSDNNEDIEAGLETTRVGIGRGSLPPYHSTPDEAFQEDDRATGLEGTIETEIEIYNDESFSLPEVALEPVSSPAAGPEPTLMNLEDSSTRQLVTGALEAKAHPLPLTTTPVRPVRSLPREVLTVSKVPLKQEDSAMNASPVKAFRRKAKSMGTGLVLQEVDVDSLPSSLQENEEANTPNIDVVGQDENSTVFSITTPLRTPRAGADAKILRGAVVYVDVHTTEGADASGLFVELLCQMGARCVKQWSWNPRSSSIGGETPGGTKVGITHVVFKDGGKRTLEKVREARGLVSCVGVGWVLDCERHNQWLDESAYTIDTSIIPRGGHNRRKSMEPRALENINGTLKVAEMTPGRDKHHRSVSTPVAKASSTEDFLDFTPTPGLRRYDGAAHDATPTINGPAFNVPTPTINFGDGMPTAFATPETPDTEKNVRWDLETPVANRGMDDEQELNTPYFMTEGARLVQATCPPKQQTGRLLFPVSGRIEDQPDKEMRKRLEVARRKSLQWAPRVASPLRRE